MAESTGILLLNAEDNDLSGLAITEEGSNDLTISSGAALHGSLACACHLEKFEFLAIEKDEDYYNASVERLNTLRSQGVLF